MRRLLLLTKYAALSVSAPKPHVCGAHRDVRHEDTSEIVVDVVVVVVVIVVAVLGRSWHPKRESTFPGLFSVREHLSWPFLCERAPFFSFFLVVVGLFSTREHFSLRESTFPSVFSQ